MWISYKTKTNRNSNTKMSTTHVKQKRLVGNGTKALIHTLNISPTTLKNLLRSQVPKEV